MEEQKRFEILLIDDDAFARQALRIILRGVYPHVKLVEADSLDEAMNLLSTSEWSLIILDLGLGNKSGLTLIHEANSRGLSLPILVLSSQKEHTAAIAAYRAGARGFISKNEASNSTLFRHAVEKILSGRKYVSETIAVHLVEEMNQSSKETGEELSSQESRVLFYLASGKSIKEIAPIMGISEKTVRTYRSRLLEKLQLKSDTEIVRYALQNGIIQ